LSSSNRIMRAIENFSTATLGPIKETKPRALSASHGPSKKGKSVQRPKGVKGWYQWFNVDGAVYSAITSLSEQAAGIGFETIMPGDDPHTTAVDKKAPELELVNEFNAYWNLDALLSNIVRNTLIAGYCPVETRIKEFPSKCAIKIIHPDSKYWEYIEYIDRLIYKSLYAGDLDYWRNATQASANILLQLVDRNIRGIRRTVKRGVEMGFWRPLIEANGMSKVPRLIWNEEQAKIDEIQLERIFQTGIKEGFVQMPQFYAFLQQAGIDLVMPDKVAPKSKEPETGGERPDDGAFDGSMISLLKELLTERKAPEKILTEEEKEILEMKKKYLREKQALVDALKEELNGS